MRISLYFLNDLQVISFFICVVQEAGVDGTFGACGIELAGVDNDGHFSSGFEKLLNMSICDVDGEGSSVVT